MKLRRRTKLGRWLDRKGIEQKELQKSAKIGRTTCYRLCNDTKHTPSVPVIRAVLTAIKKIDPHAKSSDFFDV
ncbi:TPA: helix-turn-helix domain-containing protein [Bacillus thuringiensis]|uniref:Transcriptional regulator n=1 Tax=Bacillus thuringiensis serovar iberica TaxID=180866 RepID=A0A9X6LH64_BACTU|nr:helix-turn-helix domain-containing protein [Bacillus thuringiensis]MEB9625228.1 helix-turn-helix domain-containing protein [Bacillus cereus]OUB44882.1 transcriptional regulator [Bacillus thuringiensis serovar iberica]HDR5353535.1 helix-turn-helix domain-containing protein [Bacillus thuringiensis]